MCWLEIGRKTNTKKGVKASVAALADDENIILVKEMSIFNLISDTSSVHALLVRDLSQIGTAKLSKDFIANILKFIASE